VSRVDGCGPAPPGIIKRGMLAVEERTKLGHQGRIETGTAGAITKENGAIKHYFSWSILHAAHCMQDQMTLCVIRRCEKCATTVDD
jgi:hypothetical protein